MLTKNDLQQIRTVVKEEIKAEINPVKQGLEGVKGVLEVIKKEQRSMKRKLNTVSSDLHYIIGKFDTRIVENTREIQKIKIHVGMSQ